MKTISICLLSVFALLAWHAPAHADFVVLVDLDRTAIGFQTDRTVKVGDTVVADIFLDLTSADNSLIAYNFDVQFDETLLSFTSRSETPGNLGGGFTNGVLAVNKTVSGGFVRQLEGITTDVGIVGSFANPIQIASLSFTAFAPGSSTLLSDDSDPTFNEWFNANLDEISDGVQFTPATITAVPEPSSFALLAMVAGVCACGSRRKRHQIK